MEKIKIIKEFESSEDCMHMLKYADYYGALFEIYNYVRNLNKHCNFGEEATKIVEDIYARICEETEGLLH